MDMTVQEAERILRQAGLLVDVPAGEKLRVSPGDTVRVYVSFQYRGAGMSVTLYSAIKGGPFLTEYAKGDKSVSLPNSPNSFSPVTDSVDIDIPLDMPIAADYDLDAKIIDYESQAYQNLVNVIDVLGKPEFSSFAITSYETI